MSHSNICQNMHLYGSEFSLKHTFALLKNNDSECCQKSRSAEGLQFDLVSKTIVKKNKQIFLISSKNQKSIRHIS